MMYILCIDQPRSDIIVSLDYLSFAVSFDLFPVSRGRNKKDKFFNGKAESNYE